MSLIYKIKVGLSAKRKRFLQEAESAKAQRYLSQGKVKPRYHPKNKYATCGYRPLVGKLKGR